MRDIKFRAWDKVEKKMFEPSSVSWKNGTMWVCDSHGDNKLEYEMVHPNSELMQYTGLKDKNGKEIYEGDIVGFNEDDISPMVVTWNTDTLGWFPFTIASKEYKDNIQVIGNIYDNKELLK